MGNYLSQRALENATTKVILRDGTVEEYLDLDLTVAELMLEHPQQVVVELHTAISSRPIPLAADTKLETKKVYFMLPIKRGKPAALSPEQARYIMLLTSSSSRALILPSAKYVPLFARMCSVNVGDDMHEFSTVMQRERVEEEGQRPVKRLVLPESLDGRADILSRQLSVKGNWKPSLDTIKEKKGDGKILSPSSFSFKNLAVTFSNLK